MVRDEAQETTSAQVAGELVIEEIDTYGHAMLQFMCPD
jgi:hypothetical protein